jgi:ABC-2 type transport system permease protein
MKIFWKLFKSSLMKRIREGFAIGYNIIFPVVLIIILGFLVKDNYTDIISSFQYYTVVMLPFCTLFCIITSAYAGKEEAYSGTAVRFLAAPISKGNIVLSKLLSCTFVFTLCNLLVLKVCELIWKLPLYGKFLPVALMLTAETFFSCGLGLFISYGMKNFIVVKNIINLPICILAVIGGSFFPVGTLKSGWQAVFNISPLTWINRSLFQYLYDNSSSGRNLIFRLTVIFLSLGSVISIAAILKFNKEEFLHGDISGNSK